MYAQHSVPPHSTAVRPQQALVAMAVDRGIPVVIGVPIRNLAPWRDFAGGMSVEFRDDPSEVADWLNRTFPVAIAQSPEPAAC